MSELTPLEKRIAEAVNAEQHPDLDDLGVLLGVLVATRETAEQEREDAENELAVERSCKYDAELARDRNLARAEKAERLGDEARKNWQHEAAMRAEALTGYDAEKGAREKAERERDEERAEVALKQAALEGAWREAEEAKAASERAEADNAAYIHAFNVIEHDLSEGRTEEARQRAIEVLGPDHPGAALLEERRQLRADNAKWRERWEYVAGLLGVADLGAYRADWDAPVTRTLERLRALETAATQASAELRHTYRPETRDWELVARAIRILESVTTPGVSAASEDIRALELVVEGFRALEWARTDWQGYCPFGRHKEVLCPGTDGNASGMGTPRPTPHREGCPYHALQALRGGA